MPPALPGEQSLKYSVSSDNIDASKTSSKKPGYFQSEAQLVREVRELTGTEEGMRHPLAYVIEACDDIAYSVLDVEDAIKKRFVSFADVTFELDQSDEVSREVQESSTRDHNRLRSSKGLSHIELDDLSAQRFRSHAISAMIREIAVVFLERADELLAGEFKGDLISESNAANLCRNLKSFARERAYRHPSVLKLELRGANTINALMDIVWESIRVERTTTSGRRKHSKPFTSFVYRKISENYRRVFEDDQHLPERYRELRLLTDMISGMTDRFAMGLLAELEPLEIGSRL